MNRRHFLRNGLWVAAPALLLPRKTLGQFATMPGGLLVPPVAAAGGGGGPTPIISETFDTNPGYDLSWTPQNTSPDPDYTGVILAGTQSFHATADGSRAYIDFAAQSEVWVLGMIQWTTLQSIEGEIGFYLNSANATSIQIGTGGVAGRVRMLDNSQLAMTAGTVTTGTPYYFWMHYKNDGTFDVAFSTTTTKGTGNNAASGTGGDTGTVSRLYIGNIGTSSDIIIDRVMVYATDPGSTFP